MRRRAFGMTDGLPLPVLKDAQITALAISFEDPDTSARVSSYCREAPCTLVHEAELAAIRADVKARVQEASDAESRGKYLLLAAALGGLAFGWWTWGSSR